MGILDFIFKLKSSKKEQNRFIQSEQATVSYPEEYTRVLSFNLRFDDLLQEDRFIARSDYKALITDYKDLIEFFRTLKKSGLFNDYIAKHQLDIAQIKLFGERYKEINDLCKYPPTIRQHNEAYINQHIHTEKEYLDDILKPCDPAISLDKEQREVVLSDEDHTLVIAGAGAGKTTTIAAKVRYLVEKKGIKPEQILVISFTNKAVGELKERININLKIPCLISTFHSVGYTILKQGNTSGRRIVDNGFIYTVINEYLKSTVLHNPEMVDKLIMFFGSYISAPHEGEELNQYFQYVAKADFSTLKSNTHEYVQQIIDRKTLKAQTLNDEIVRSMEEVRIANFLYMNQIEYEYEPIYQYKILDSNKPYTPDFLIKQGDKIAYIEHFGITEDGRNNRYTDEEIIRYKQQINEKVKIHRKHNTNLIYTFSVYNDGIDYLDHLKNKLIENGFELNKRSAENVYKRLVDKEESKYITKLTLLICNFIGNFKTQGYKSEQFNKFKLSIKNVRTKLFLDICRACYLEYQQALEENHCIDFEDMINESAELIKQQQISGEQLDYKYIIIDEYQDISRQRYNLIREISKVCSAKVIAVGDDWQSIYAFSGSILPLFTKFCQEVGYGQELKITRTYRNAQELIDIAGTFVQKNASQIRKDLVSSKRIDNPVIICSFSEDKKQNGNDDSRAFVGQAVNKAIEQIIDFNNKECINGVASILLIGRYGFDGRKLAYCRDFNYDEATGNIYSSKFGPKVKLSFLTAHSSKGLSADNVIIINAKDATYGFPSKVDDDPVLQLVVNNDDSYDYAEERRLFYVALTRTRNRVLIITPEKHPSDFIKELISDKKSYPNVLLNGELKTDLSINNSIKDRCPICGYPMQYRWNKNYGLRLWICTNDQEICGFMTNDKRGGELSIQKCDHCQDGYLVVKSGNNNFFLGCTNYKSDKTGCGRTLSFEQYKAWHNTDFGKSDLSINKPSYLKVDNNVVDIPKPSVESKIKTKRKKAEVHKVKSGTIIIEDDNFTTVLSSKDELLTDKKLLEKLRIKRMQLAKEKNLPAYLIMQNKTLALIATERPTTREKFINIYGIGERKYELYGEAFIKVIKDHLNNI